MKKALLYILSLILLAGCAARPNLENTESSTGLGSSPFSTGGRFTAANANAINNAVNDNDTRIDTIEALTGPVFSDGDGTYTDMSVISSTELGYLNGVTSAIQTQLNSKFDATGDLDPDQLTGDSTDNDKVDGGIVSPSAATGVTVDDSGDGNPATGSVSGFYSGVGLQSYVVICNDSDGCAMTMSETGAMVNMVIPVINSESSTGSLTFATSSGVQSVRSSRTVEAGESITFIYRDDYWDEVAESTEAYSVSTHNHDASYELIQTEASQAEMEAGTESTIRSISPLRAWQGIAGYLSAKNGWGTYKSAVPDQADQWVGMLVWYSGYTAGGANADPCGLHAAGYDDAYQAWLTQIGTPGTWIPFRLANGVMPMDVVWNVSIGSTLADTSSPHVLTDEELRNNTLSNADATGAELYTLPEHTPTSGWNFDVRCETTNNMTLSPNGAGQLHLYTAGAWTAGGAGQDIENTACTVGEFMRCRSAYSGVYCTGDADWVFASAAATDYRSDPNNMGSWFMNNNGGDEVDRTTAGTETLTHSSAPPTSATVPATYAGTSRSFTYTDPDFLYHADGGNTDISGADQSISFGGWVRTSDKTADQTFIAKGTSSGTDRQYYIRYDTGNDSFWCGISDTTTTSTYAESATGLTNDTYAHVVCVSNDTDIRIYVNGALDSNGASNPKAYTSGIVDGTGTFRIGSFGGSGHWRGLIDEIFVFDRALSASEVLEIYTSGIDGANGAND